MDTVKQLLAESTVSKISEMLDLFWSEGLQKEPPAEYTAGELLYFIIIYYIIWSFFNNA